MKIGLVCPYSFDTPGGVQNHVLGLAAHLRSVGHDPHILAPGEFAPGADDQLQWDSFTSAGAAIPVPYNGSIARVNFGPLSAARVRRWLHQGNFDLIHLHEPITPSISVLALWASDVPVVATFHTATPRSRSMQLARSALRPAIEKIDAGIAVSESARNVVIQHLGRDALVVPNGFSHAEFSHAEFSRGQGRSGAAEGTGPLLSFLGRLDEPRKGLDVLLAALPTIRERHPNIRVAIAGQGSRSLPPDCLALGAVTNTERAALLGATDIFVAPHRARESFGIVLLEAMAAGATVVASDLPAFTDLLSVETGGRSVTLGHTFRTGDPMALAAAVDTALDDVARQWADNTLVRVADEASRQYDWSVVGAQILRVYQAVLAANRLVA